MKGNGRIDKGFTDKGNVEAKRSSTTGQGMPSILGPFPEDGFGLDFVGQLTTAELGIGRLEGTGSPFLSDIWGWTDRTKSKCKGDEYALVGSSAGMSFVRITDASIKEPNPARHIPVFLGLVLTQNESTLLNFWRDVKVYNNTAYWTTEVLNPGLEYFDLTQLCDLDGPPEDGLLTTVGILEITLGSDSYQAAHNISINEKTGMAYLTGVTSLDRSQSRDPMWIVDLNEIDGDTIEAAGSVFRILNSDGIDVAIDSHDAQVVNYTGPDRRDHRNRKIALVAAGFNEELVIFDVTEPDDVTQISAITYDGASFTHQGWLDDTQSYFFMGDEEDELFGISDPNNPDLPDTTRTYVFDVRDLDVPKLYCFFDAPYASIDHNMFVLNNLLYQANYTSGFTVWDFSTMDQNAENCGMVEVGHMDTEPRLPNESMNHNINIFVGPWGIYPYFDSGKIIVSDGLNGLIVSKLSE